MKDLKSLIKKEFFSVLSPYGFVSYKTNLIINPINDLLKGYCFDKHDNRLYVHLFVQPMYVPAKNQSLSYGWRLKGSSSGNMFLLNDEHLEYAISEIRKLILSEKDILLETKTALDFYNKFLVSDLSLLTSRSDTDIRYQETLTLTQAYIHPEKTCILVDEFLEKWEMDNMKSVGWMQEIKSNLLLLKQACASKENVQNLFDQWKKFTVMNLKLEKIK